MRGVTFTPAFVVLSCLGGLVVPVRGEVPAIVFVSRELSGAPKPDLRKAAIERAARGRLLVLEPGGDLRQLVDAASAPGAGLPVDVIDPEVSYDARRILFAGYVEAEMAWRIFEIGADGSGLRQITGSDRRADLARYGQAAALLENYDDVDPCYLPDGRICFVSTRYPGIAPDGRVRTTNLYVVNADGTGLHRITTERFGADTPAVEPSTGQIVYSRWWRTAQAVADPGSEPPEPIPPGSPGYGNVAIDESELVQRGIAEERFPGVNSWFLSSIDPDGTDLAMYSGFRLDRALTQAYRPAFSRGGEALALFIPQTPFYGYPRGNGLRLFTLGPSRPVALGGPQGFPPPRAAGNGVDPRPLPPVPPPLPYVYASAQRLPDGQLLVTAADTRVALDYGIYLQDGAGAPAAYRNLPGSAELDALPLAARPLPPIVADKVTETMAEEAPRTVEEAYAQAGSFVFLCENIHSNAPVDVAIPNAPPIGKRLTIEFFMSPQRESTTASDPPILIRRLDIPPGGKIQTELPAGVPLFEVLRRPDGTIPLGRDGQIFHVGGMNFGRAGETNRCVGCHAGHSQMKVPADPAWTNVAPSAAVRSSNPRVVDAAVNSRGLFQDANLVDRQTGDPATEWAAVGPEGPNVELHWSAKVRARELVFHGIRPGKGQFGERNLVVHGLTVDLLLDRQVLARLEVRQDIRPEGTAIAVDPSIEFNALRLVIPAENFTGLYEGKAVAALAEVEVIAQAASGPSTTFVRGDSNCDTRIDISDAILILANRFLGAGTLCCEAGADANDDGAVDISDPIFLLWFQFLGRSPPPPPFPLCGPGHGSTVSCDVDVCF